MKTLFTVIDPIPSHIPRQLAIELLQSHGELIHVNPLVLDYNPIKAPRDAPSDEFYATWYEINQRIQFVPGMGKMGSGKVSFRGCFHDMPWGVQTHMYVPMGIELRHKYQVKGNQPGEPPEQRELGTDAPTEGLYLRTDIQIKANMTMMSFVKKEQKAANKIMIDRMIKKAELIDAGKLQAMFDDHGKLATVNPADRSRLGDPSTPATSSAPSVYGPNGFNLRSPSVSSKQSQSAYAAQSFHNSGNSQSGSAVEMMGDTGYGSSQNLHPSSRFSTHSELSSPGQQDSRWSGAHSENHSSHDGSVRSGPTASAYSGDFARSPRPDTKSFAVELPGNEIAPARPPKESPNPEAQYHQEQQQQQPQQGYQYNPQHYAGVGGR